MGAFLQVGFSLSTRFNCSFLSRQPHEILTPIPKMYVVHVCFCIAVHLAREFVTGLRPCACPFCPRYHVSDRLGPHDVLPSSQRFLHSVRGSFEKQEGFRTQGGQICERNKKQNLWSVGLFFLTQSQTRGKNPFAEPQLRLAKRLEIPGGDLWLWRTHCTLAILSLFCSRKDQKRSGREARNSEFWSFRCTLLFFYSPDKLPA